MILASAASARSNKAVSFPWLITAMRSESASASSRSDVTKMIPMPLRGEFAHQAEDIRLRSDVDASARLVHQQDFRLVSSALPITTFCWFPPESDETGKAGSATLIVRFFTSRRTTSASTRDRMWKTRVSLRRLAIVRFSATDRIATSPSRCRSSGISASPRAIRPLTSLSRTSSPSI